MPSGIYERTEEHKRNIGLAGRGRSAWNKGIPVGHPVGRPFIKGNINHNAGKQWDEATKKKISDSHKRFNHHGERNQAWKGGNSRNFRVKNAPRPRPEVCEVCGAFAGTGKAGIHYDHDHTTGEFRGWICMRCNIALGMVKDNAETLVALSEYLLKSRIKL